MLTYTTDDMPGIRRKGAGKGFFYISPQGQRIKDKKVIERIRALAIPPAYKDVWICELPNGHLQATGRDQRGRKQYRYHPDWQAQRNLDKFEKLPYLGESLPKLRRKVRRDIKRLDGSKQFVVATAIRMIDRSGFRVGNEQYLKSNKTRGISTLSNKNVQVDESNSIKVSFRAKGGREVESTITDLLLSDAISECHDLGGQRLFTYHDAKGETYSIDSSDINSYLDSVFPETIRAKDLRTWRASTHAADYLMNTSSPDAHEKAIKSAIEYAAGCIKNRYTTCKKHYIHPRIVEAYTDLEGRAFSTIAYPSIPELTTAESFLLHLLKEPKLRTCA